MTSSLDEIQLANLRELRREYIDSRPHVRQAERRALRDADRKDAEDLLWDLRHHDEELIEEEGTWFRDGIDYVLSFYSVWEIGALTGQLPPTAPWEWRADAIGFLDHPAVRMYYEVRYPLTLPMRFRSRLMSGLNSFDDLYNDTSSFHAFLELTKPIENDEDLESFLWFLDGGVRWDAHYRRYVDIDDTRRMLRRPKEFIKALSTAPRSRDELDASVVGFGKFLQFCREMDALLTDVKKQPRLQAYYWHYHEYWFKHAAERLRQELPKAINEFSKWKSPDRRTQMDYKRDSTVLKAAVRRLTSGAYGKGLTAEQNRRGIRASARIR